MKEEIQIKKINAKATYPIRHSVLRKGRPIESCEFEGDTLESSIHFGSYFKGSLVGVCSFYVKEQNQQQNKPQRIKPTNGNAVQNCYQLRGMAVLESMQGKGIGQLLVIHAEAYFKSKIATLIWMNAREVAISFYKKLGYTITGASFDIPQVGKHYKMIKEF